MHEKARQPKVAAIAEEDQTPMHVAGVHRPRGQMPDTQTASPQMMQGPEQGVVPNHPKGSQQVLSNGMEGGHGRGSGMALG